MSSKPKRIYQIAKQINISHQEIMDFLQEKGIKATSHMSPVDEDTYSLILEKFAPEIHKLEQSRKEAERRALEEKQRQEEEARIRREEEERRRREEEERQRREAEEQRLREIEQMRRRQEEEARLAEEREARAKAEAEAAAALEQALKAKKPAEEEAQARPVQEKIIAKKIERKIKHIIRAKDEKPKKDKKAKKGKKLDDKEIEASVRRVMSSMTKTKRRRRKSGGGGQQETAEEDVIKITEFIPLYEFAELAGVDVVDVISKCMELGMMVTINQRIDRDTIELLAEEYGLKIAFEDELARLIEEDEEAEESPEDLQPRPPIVTVMGHVDHGKTSLLDYIRKTNVIAGEAGGITQHIGAYSVQVGDGKSITFLDTPGHEAFTAMRARGAQVTDIAVIVVAADDAVMPQTVEAIDHAKAAGVPMIIAINKIDKPNADPEKVRRGLSEIGILVESWGGKYPDVEISAKHGTNVDTLLETILLEAELLELKANPKGRAKGVVLESRLDRGLGAVATVLIEKGTLKVGQPFICGEYYGKVRALLNERGQRIKEAGPAIPAQVLGMKDVPRAGDRFLVMESEAEARKIALERQQIKREQDLRRIHVQTLDEISKQISEGKTKELNIIIKGDVDGSIEALADSLMKLSNEEVAVRIIHKGIGMIKESDILLASASKAVIIGFNVTSDSKARLLAKSERVEVRTYNVIYNVVDDIRKALEGMLEPEKVVTEIGRAEVLAVFKIPGLGRVAGVRVIQGQARKDARVKVHRDNEVIYEGEVASLKHFQEDVKEVQEGNECGVAFKDWEKVKVGDVLEFYTEEFFKRTLN